MFEPTWWATLYLKGKLTICHCNLRPVVASALKLEDVETHREVRSAAFHTPTQKMEVHADSLTHSLWLALSEPKQTSLAK